MTGYEFETTSFALGYYVGYYAMAVTLIFLLGITVGAAFWALLRITRGVRSEVRRLFPQGDHLNREAMLREVGHTARGSTPAHNSNKA